MNTNLAAILVPAPARQPQPAPRVSPDATLPYWGVFLKVENRWIRSQDLANVVAEYCALRDCGNFGAGYGARDMGGEPIYLTSVSALHKRKVGKISYNGNVALTVVT